MGLLEDLAARTVGSNSSLFPTPGVPQAAPVEIPTLSPEEEEGILKRIGSSILGGAAYVGGALNKPGRAVRGLLGGNLREALSFIPLSDFLHITRPEQEISGRKLLENWDILDRNVPGLDAGDVAGFGLEMALDPLTYLGGIGALTKAGKAASKVGELAPTLAGRIRAGQAGLTSIGFPFQEKLFGELPKAIGTGPLSIKAAELLGGARKAISESALGLGASALFEKAARGTTSLIGRTLGRSMEAGTARSSAQYMKKAYDFTDKMVAAGLNTPEGEELLTKASEGLVKLDEVHPVIAEIVREKLSDHARTAAYAAEWGADVPQWTSKHAGVQYNPRYATGPLTAQGEENLLKSPRTAMGFGGESTLTREQIHDVPGGTAMLNRMSMDRALRAEAGDLASRRTTVLKKYLGWDDAKLAEHDDLIKRGVHSASDEDLAKIAYDKYQARGMQPGLADQDWREALELRAKARGLADEFNQAEHLADEMANLPEYYSKTQNPLFANSMIKDATRRDIVVDQMGRAAEETQKLFSQQAIFDPIEGFHGTVVHHGPKKEGYMRVVDAFKDIGLTGKNAETKQAELLLASGLIEDANQLKHVWVPQDTVKQINRVLDMYKAPEALKTPVKIFDWMNNLFKAGVYAPWPASTIRDFAGNVVAATSAAEKPLKYFGDMKWMRSVLEGHATGADREMMREMASWGIRPGTTAAGEVIGEVAGRRPERITDLYKQIPGGTPLSAAIKQYIPRNLREAIDIRQIKGVGPFKKAITEGSEQIEDVFAAVRGGRATKEYSDLLTKGALWKNLRDAGFSQEETWKRVMASLVDYSNLSQFEKSVMKRVFPFYTFTRHMLPYTVQELIHKPGGLWATALKAEHRAQQEAGFTPEYLTSGIALPLGEGRPGTQRYLTTLGLPFETPLEFMRGGPGAASRNLSTILGQTTPILKAPIEMATGKQLFSGRELSDLQGLTGVQGLDQLISMSPASRLVSTLRTLTNPNKSLLSKATNVLTGARITDTDLEKARDIAINEAVSRELQGVKGARTFKQTYVPKDIRETLNQDQLMLLGLQRTRLKEARERAKAIANQ